jgi:hypothetical protein
MQKLYLDTETCGLYGMPVLLQYAIGDGPIVLYEIWRRPIRETLSLVESFLPHIIVGFNLTFDWFQLCKLYTIFRLCPGDWIPEQHIEEIAVKELDGRDGPCLKPASALDLMLHSRKGPYQSLMGRKDIKIRRVPSVIAPLLLSELEKRIAFKPIYGAKWRIVDRKKAGQLDPHFKDVVLKFKARSGLKYIAEDALGLKPKFHFKDVEPASRPIELGYAPFASAVSTAENGWYAKFKDKKGHAWPALIAEHTKHWAENEQAREYATDDIVYLQKLDRHFGYPEPGDDDSILACMVAAVRWHGLQINLEGIQRLREKALKLVATSPVNTNKPTEIRAYLIGAMDEVEKLLPDYLSLQSSTDKKTLKLLAKWDGPVGERARQVLDIKFAKKEVELYDKLLLAKRLHASFVIIGAKSARMSGADGLNPQGIKATYDVRENFPLAWDNYKLSGGDFDAFEVTLADAVFDDESLRRDLKTKAVCAECNGKKVCYNKKCRECHGAGSHVCEECKGEGQTTQKIHALFAQALNPGKSYAEIISTKGTQYDLYDEGKKGFFGGILYMGGWNTLVGRLGKSKEVAQKAFEEFSRRYAQVKVGQQKITEEFQCVWQPGGPRSEVVWKQPADFVESFLGFRRYFTPENEICRKLFELARTPPESWRNLGTIHRSDRDQTIAGATCSALYGASFGLAGVVVRAAGNHKIQSPGGQITKALQRATWEEQPVGVHDLIVAPINIHDELMVPTHPDHVDSVAQRAESTIDSFRSHVPLIGMTWNRSMSNWAEKKSPLSLAA